MMDRAFRIFVRGLVQGVGFRPFIYLLASKMGIKGWVKNTNEGVEIYAVAPSEVLTGFIRRIQSEAPVASDILEVEHQPAEAVSFPSFEIRKSENLSEEITCISPDIAVCQDCLEDIQKMGHRWQYPFVNCTNCGPRYSIIREIPYDRKNTSMDPFTMCGMCSAEYENIEDRRFHAQPVACLNCGPEYEIRIGDSTITGKTDQILTPLVQLLSSGKIVAIKGIGGYHLACDAFNEKAVTRLRSGKQRDGKPFAVMFRDPEKVSDFAHLNKKEMEILTSWRRPILILDLKEEYQQDPCLTSINSGLGSIGVFLPYMPLHHILFRDFHGHAIVLTSGNLSSDPIIKDDHEARELFTDVADAVVSYNREIVNRTDDSVVRVVNNKPRLIRRSRGYVPSPVPVTVNVDHMVALGAELSSVFAVGRNFNVFPGPYIGDLKTVSTYEFFESTLQDFIRLFRVKPEIIACDLHPLYFSSRFALDQKEVTVVQIQHHHAHIASCMAEHGIDEEVVGVAFDGTGLGDDGKIWGAEFMVCDLAKYKRMIHFEYIGLPGGDKAVEEPWRTATAYLYKVFGDDFVNLQIPFFNLTRSSGIMTVKNMLQSGVSCPEVSSAGRLFDAVAAILGVVVTNSFQAEAPMRLESMVLRNCKEKYPYRISDVIQFDLMFREMVQDLISGADRSVIATKFHNTVISTIFEAVLEICRKRKLTKVVLSGGVFQNRYLLSKTEKMLQQEGLMVFSNQKVPVNDGGLSLGQIIIAAKRRQLGCV